MEGWVGLRWLQAVRYFLAFVCCPLCTEALIPTWQGHSKGNASPREGSVRGLVRFLYPPQALGVRHSQLAPKCAEEKPRPSAAHALPSSILASLTAWCRDRESTCRCNPQARLPPSPPSGAARLSVMSAVRRFARGASVAPPAASPPPIRRSAPPSASRSLELGHGCATGGRAQCRSSLEPVTSAGQSPHPAMQGGREQCGLAGLFGNPEAKWNGGGGRPQPLSGWGVRLPLPH